MQKKILIIVANSFPLYCSIAKHIEIEHLEKNDHVDVFNYVKIIWWLAIFFFYKAKKFTIFSFAIISKNCSKTQI